ncbi:hypothetical protein ABIF62_003093 [Bradyrhizobium japonicum]
MGRAALDVWGDIPRDVQEALFEAAMKGREDDRQELARLLHDRHPRTLHPAKPNCPRQPVLTSAAVAFLRGVMAEEVSTTTGIVAHGASRLPSVEIDSFNIELKDDEGFIGDRASKVAFRDILEKWRKPLRKTGEDPFGKEPSESIGKKVLDAILIGADTEASAVVHSAIEDFAQELAYVTRRFLKSKPRDKTERIVVGGGFRESRLGELAIARTEIILKSDNFKIEMFPIRNHPDDAGLIGALHLAPSWIFESHDSILAVDIGGTNIRCGVVETRRKKSPDLAKACVWKSELWRHADDEPNREQAVKRLVKMLKDLIAKAEKEGFKLAPFIGIACPGVIKRRLDREGCSEPSG